MSKRDEDSAEKKDKPKSANITQNGVVFKYDILVRSNENEIVKLQGSVPMPLFLDPAGIHQAELNFKKIFDALVADPVKLQVQTTIRAKQKEIEDAEAEAEMEKAAVKTNDVFMLTSKPELKEEPEENPEEKNDQQQKSSDNNSSEERKQGNTKQEHSDGEWEAPGAVSG